MVIVLRDSLFAMMFVVSVDLNHQSLVRPKDPKLRIRPSFMKQGGQCEITIYACWICLTLNHLENCREG